jgi:hypothetical protein
MTMVSEELRARTLLSRVFFFLGGVMVLVSGIVSLFFGVRIVLVVPWREDVGALCVLCFILALAGAISAFLSKRTYIALVAPIPLITVQWWAIWLRSYEGISTERIEYIGIILAVISLAMTVVASAILWSIQSGLKGADVDDTGPSPWGR